MLEFFEKLSDFKNFFSIKTDKKLVIFYSENLNYRNYLLPLANRFANEEKFKTVYVTSDLNDKKKFNKNVETFYIGTGFFRLAFFTLVKCDFLITSLSNLNNNIKVSKKCKKLVYVPHALCSTHKVYERSAFQHYDIFFATGNYQKVELEKAEKTYNFNQKKIFNVGYVFFENFKKKEEALDLKEKNNIIFAPSWQRGKRNLLEDHGKKIIKILLEKNFSVTLRIHPEAAKRLKYKIKSLTKDFMNENNFIINTNLQDFSFFKKSEILISDNGGVALEYIYLYNKPVLYINYSEKIQNEDFKSIHEDTFEDTFKKDYCHQIDIKNIENIDQKIIELKSNYSDEKIRKSIDYINKNIYNEDIPSNNIFRTLNNL